MAEPVHELRERAEAANHRADLIPATVTMTVLAVLVAATSLAAHRSHTAVLRLETEAADQWAFFQAKSIRRHNYEIFSQVLQVLDSRNAEQRDRLVEEFKNQAAVYRGQQDEIQTKANQTQQQIGMFEHRGNRLDLAEIFLEVALIITSLMLLTHRRIYWLAGLVIGAMGLASALTNLLAH